MIKNRNIGKQSQLKIDETKTSTKITKKKPKYQIIIRSLKAQIQELQKEVQLHESEKDKEIKRMFYIINEQDRKIKTLEQENNKLSSKLKKNGFKEEVNKVSFTIGNSERLVDCSITKQKQYASVKLTDRTPRKTKQNNPIKGKYDHHQISSKSMLDIPCMFHLPHRFNLSSSVQVPLVNVFNSELKDSNKRNKIICRSIKNEYRSHKCNSRCNSRTDQYR